MEGLVQEPHFVDDLQFTGVRDNSTGTIDDAVAVLVVHLPAFLTLLQHFAKNSLFGNAIITWITTCYSKRFTETSFLNLLGIVQKLYKEEDPLQEVRLIVKRNSTCTLKAHAVLCLSDAETQTDTNSEWEAEQEDLISKGKSMIEETSNPTRDGRDEADSHDSERGPVQPLDTFPSPSVTGEATLTGNISPYEDPGERRLEGTFEGTYMVPQDQQANYVEEQTRHIQRHADNPLATPCEPTLNEDADNSAGIENTLGAANEDDCPVCFGTEKQVVLLPCGHFGLCLGCSQRVSRCPVSICGGLIQATLRAYRA